MITASVVRSLDSKLPKDLVRQARQRTFRKNARLRKKKKALELKSKAHVAHRLFMSIQDDYLDNVKPYEATISKLLGKCHRLSTELQVYRPETAASKDHLNSGLDEWQQEVAMNFFPGVQFNEEELKKWRVPEDHWRRHRINGCEDAYDHPLRWELDRRGYDPEIHGPLESAYEDGAEIAAILEAYDSMYDQMQDHDVNYYLTEWRSRLALPNLPVEEQDRIRRFLVAYEKAAKLTSGLKQLASVNSITTTSIWFGGS